MMAIYVDEAIWSWRGKMWCHLLADSLAELHEFADKLGLKREWFQEKARFPHYDITDNMRTKAIHIGAISANRSQIAEVALLIQSEFRQQSMENATRGSCGHITQRVSAANI